MLRKNKILLMSTVLIIFCAWFIFQSAKPSGIATPTIASLPTTAPNALQSETVIQTMPSPLPSSTIGFTATPSEPLKNMRIIAVTKDKQIVIFDTDGENQKISPEGKECDHPKLSPDKTMLAYICHASTGPEILVADLQTLESSTIWLPETYTSDLLVYTWNDKHLFVGYTDSYWLVTLNQDNWANILSAIIYDVNVVTNKYTVYAAQKFPVLDLWTSTSGLLVQTAHYEQETKIDFVQYDEQGGFSDLGFDLSFLEGDQAAVSPDGKYLAYYTGKDLLQKVHVFDLELKKERLDFALAGYRIINSLPAWSGDGRYLVINVTEKPDTPYTPIQTFIYDTQLGQAKRFCRCPASLTFSNDENYFAYIQNTINYAEQGPGLYVERAGNKQTIKDSGFDWEFPIVLVK